MLGEGPGSVWSYSHYLYRDCTNQRDPCTPFTQVMGPGPIPLW
jgi:hypothetical protein